MCGRAGILGFEKTVGFSIGNVFVAGWEPQRWPGGTAGVLLCPVSLGAEAKRGRFVPAATVSAVGHCPRNWAARLMLGLATPRRVNLSCEEPSVRSEQGHLVGGMC